MSAEVSILSLAVDPAVERDTSDIAAIRDAIAKLGEDPGAHLTAELRQAWDRLYERKPEEFERLREQAKSAGARVTEIDKVVGARNKRVSKPRSRSGGAGPVTAVPSPVDSPSASRTSTAPALGSMPPGALLDYSQNDQPRRKVQSEAASVVASVLFDRLRWDAESGTWLLAQPTHWEAQSTPAKAVEQIATNVAIGTSDGPGSVGYTRDYLNGVIEIIQKQGLLPPPAPPSNVVPFLNGLLDIEADILTPARADYATRYVLPHHFDPNAQCPIIRAWLLRAVGGDPETVELLRAWLAALVRGIPLQKFLLLLGRGGSGKGTFQRLAVALVGQKNVAISALRDLEENRFELAKLVGKRLCMINEAGRHGGSLNMLKAVTGGDHLPIERKHQQQHGSFVFDGLVLMASNEDLRSTDHTSGLERRRLIVRFPRSATLEEKAAWLTLGGEAAVLHPEIPGLIRWVLALPVAAIHRLIESPPARVARDNLLGMAAGNNIADWLMERAVPERGTVTQVGHKTECRVRETGATYYEHADERLYPNYLTWCLETGASPVSLRRFADTIVDMAETLGHPVERTRHPQSRAAVVRGLRLRRSSPDSEDPWTPAAASGSTGVGSPQTGPEGPREDAGGVEPASRMDRMDFGPQLPPHSCKSQGGVSSTHLMQDSAPLEQSAQHPSDPSATRVETLRDPSVMRIPDETGHRFHVKVDTDSTANWTPIPAQTGH